MLIIKFNCRQKILHDVTSVTVAVNFSYQLDLHSRVAYEISNGYLWVCLGVSCRWTLETVSGPWTLSLRVLLLPSASPLRSFPLAHIFTVIFQLWTQLTTEWNKSLRPWARITLSLNYGFGAFCCSGGKLTSTVPFSIFIPHHSFLHSSLSSWLIPHPLPVMSSAWNSFLLLERNGK